MKTIYNIDRRIIEPKISDLLEPPVKIRVNHFDEEAAEDFARDISKAHHTGQPVIPVIIDSFGGYVYSLIAMMDMIDSSHIPVATIAVGKAMSCGSILLSCGAEGLRFCSANSTIMVHDVSAMHWGKNEELKASTKQTDYLNRLVFRRLAKNCGQDKDYFLSKIHDKGHAEWYLTANQAKKENIVNVIGIPALQVNVSVNIELLEP